jgi:SAM-dependent methyltransferase
MDSGQAERIERERQFHDQRFGTDVRAEVDRFYELAQGSSDRYRELLLSRAAGVRVLELGCGPGSFALPLAETGADVLGIDVSPVAITQARASVEGTSLERPPRFEVMNAEELELPDASMDLVCGTGILHHLALPRALAEVSRVLKPAGSALFKEPLGHNPLINFYRNRTPDLRTRDEHPLLESDLRLAESHFEETKLHFFHLASLLAVPLRGRAPVGNVVRMLDRIDAALFKRVPRARKYAWIVILELSRPRGRRARRKVTRSA